ncbi:hypothetical protein CVIRNUC_007622 [Coccomyxa viridis]|uniref:Uncharacterized protein n=1 Tax=Coccomyxa viridis TaxID=1274662 RepID=A0AAV1IB29_9CHLO|nr:hypothetical protein CVIRNUC_007622 [Coccomyxa viridis]
MTAEDGLTPGASALYSLSRVVSDSSCVITHPIRDVWALVREWGSCPWLTELDGRPHKAVLLDGDCNTAVGARRVLHIGDQRMFERLTAVDDEDHILKWKLISHADTVNPFLASLVNHDSRIKLTPIVLGNHTLIEWQGTFFTEPQRAPSMKATFGKLHVQGFRSLQNLLTATVMSRSHSTSEASETARLTNGRGMSLNSQASSLNSSHSYSHKSSSQGSSNGDREGSLPTLVPPSKYSQAYPKAGQPLSSMRNFRGTSLETIPSNRELPMDDLAIRSISDVEAGTPADKGQQTNDQERSAPAETNPFRDASEEAGVKDRRREDKQSDEGEKRREDKPQDANTPVSNGIQGSGGAFTFNDKLLAPTSAAGPQMPPAGKCLSLPNANAGIFVSAAGPTSSPMYHASAEHFQEMLAAARRNSQRWPSEDFPHSIMRTGSDSFRFTDDACELARVSANDLQRINSAFHRSRSLGRSGSGPEPSDPMGSRVANGGTAGMRGHAELPPLSQGPMTGFPLDRGADMLMPQLVHDSRGSSSSGAPGERSLTRSGSGRVSLDHWVEK